MEHADRQAPIEIAGLQVDAGQRKTLRIPVAEQFAAGEASIPAVVIHGLRHGPQLFVCSTIHGDEINGVEIIRRLLGMTALRRLRGTLIAVPVVNVFGFPIQSRYLPDRRDLNRSFPGSAKGSLAARLAKVFMTEVVEKSTHGIDLHTGAFHRCNLPHIRASLDDPESTRLAHAFGVPVIVNANIRDGSLRQAALERGIPMLLYEAGQALRFDEVSIRAGVRGILGVMRALSMIRESRRSPSLVEPTLARSTSWVRAPQGGLLQTRIPLGARIEGGATLGLISDPAGQNEIEVKAQDSGILIGRTELPLVNEGDAMFHIASVRRPHEAEAHVETFHSELDAEQETSESGDPAIR
jgi:predicted deacylase